MKTARQVIDAAGVCMSLGGVTASVFALDRGWYLGGNLGNHGLTIEEALGSQGVRAFASLEISASAYALTRGHQASDNIAVDGGHIDLGKYGFNVSANSSSAVGLIGEHKSQGLSLAGKGTVPLGGRFSAYGKLGTAWLKTELNSDANTGNVADTGRHATKLIYGLGLGDALSKNVDGDLEWDRHDHVGDGSSTGEPQSAPSCWAHNTIFDRRQKGHVMNSVERCAPNRAEQVFRPAAWAWACVLMVFCGAAAAQHDHGTPHMAHDAGHGWALDSRYHHDHYYPVRGTFFHDLPGGYRRVFIGGVPYFFFAGVWYRPYLQGYIVVGAPLGAVIPVLPPGYTAVWIGASVYYYANGVYYSSLPGGEYEVVNPPVGTAAPAVTEPTPATTAPAPVPAPVVRTVPAGDGLFVYPRQKQSDLKAADDRHACDLWAQQQTGYDFERPGQSNPDLFDNFQRAVIACLDARGYSAR